MKKLKIFSLVLVLMLGVVCFSGCSLFNREKVSTYEALSDSMAPAIVCGDKVKIKEKSIYEVGDIVLFTHNGLPIIHRIIFKFVEDNEVYFVCKGDGVQNLDYSVADGEWADDALIIENFIDDGATMVDIMLEYGAVVQILTESQIEGYVFDIIKQ